MKKLLSIVLALSLCLTAMMGCFVVSAAETNSVVVTGTTFNVGEATTATATIEIESTGFAAAMLDISFKGLDINAKALAEDETDTGVYEPDIAVTSTSSDVIVFSDNSINDAGFGDVTVANASDSIRLILDASGETLGYFEDATIVITFVAPAAGSYDVKVDAITAGTAGTYDIDTGAYTGGDETLIKNEDFTIKNGSITAHAHDYATPKYDENGHWTACACGAATEKVAHTLGEYVANEDGTTETATCTGCEYSVTRDIEVTHEHTWGELEYSVVDDGSTYGACVTTRTCTDETCGEIETVSTLENLKFGHNPVYESSLTLKFRLPADTTTVEYLKGFSNIEAVFTKELFSKNTPIDPGVTTIAGTLVPDSTRTEFIYDEVRSVDLPSRIDCHVYGINSDGYKVLIAHENYSFVDYIKTALASSGYMNAQPNTKNYYARQLVIDIANYGAAAQEKFGYNTTNLANKDIDQTYATPEITEFNGTLEETGARFWRAPVYESQIFINIRFLKSVATEGSYVVVQYPTVSGGLLSYTVPYEEFVEQPENTQRWQFEHKQLNAATLTSEFYVTLYDADGNELGYTNYSMEIYAQQALASSSSTDADKALVKKLVAYARSANTYFNF